MTSNYLFFFSDNVYKKTKVGLEVVLHINFSIITTKKRTKKSQ